MATAFRTYRMQASHRPIYFDGHWWAWGRVPSILNIHSTVGLDGDWARWRLYQLDSAGSEVWASGLVKLEQFTGDSPTDPIDSRDNGPVLACRDLEFYPDPHANPFAALSGKYLLFCPAPECQLLCWDLEEKVEAWRLDSRRPDNGTVHVFRILCAAPDNSFAVSFRERHYIPEVIEDLAWNPIWGEDSDTIVKETHSADLEADNISPCGYLRLDAATGAELARWESEEIAEGLFSQPAGESFYKYTDPILGPPAPDITGIEDMNENGGWFYNSSGGVDNLLEVNGQTFELRPGKSFIGPTRLQDGHPWTVATCRVIGAGEDLPYQWNGSAYYVSTPEDQFPEPEDYDSTYPGSAMVPPFWSPKNYCTGVILYTGLANDGVTPTEKREASAFSSLGSTEEAILDYFEVTPANSYLDGAGFSDRRMVTNLSGFSKAITDYLPNPLTPVEVEGHQQVRLPFLGVPFASYARDGSAVADPENEPFTSIEWTSDWYKSAAFTPAASINFRLFIGLPNAVTLLPGALPPHSLSLCGSTEWGVVYGPNTDPARTDLDLHFRSIDWDGTVRWTRTIATSLPCRQATAPVAIGGRVLTVVQEYQPSTTAGDVRVITLNADTGAVILDDPIDPDLFGGFDFDLGASGVHLPYEAVVKSGKLLFSVNGRIILAQS